LTGKLNSASWEVFADNISQGKTQIAYYSVASADFYPANNNNEMWMDDVSFKYTSFATPTLDAALGVVQIAGVKLKGLMDTVKTDVRNLGNKAITSVDVSVTHNGATVSESFSGLNITTGNVKTLNFTTMIAVAEGKNPITAAITKVNGTAGDDYSGDDSVITSAFGVTPTPGKIIIAEEKTGTWCPWCVRGTVYMGFMNQNYGKYWAGIAVHNKDPMTVTKYDSFSSADWSGGYPNLIFMRDSLFDPQGVEAKFLKEIVKPISCTLKNGATWDATSRTLKVSVTSDYIKNVNGDWRAACVLTEDSVTGTGSTYSQANAYAKNSNGKMGGFENLPNPVPYSQMKYDDVARVILPHTNGVAGMLPTNIKTGEKHTINLEYVLPATWNEKKINLVSFIIKPDGSIDNGTKSSIDEAITNGFVAVGIEENTALKSEIDMFPNPGSDIINVNLINAGNKNTVLNFRNIEGKLIQQYVVNPTATYSSTAIDISSLPQGVYFVDMNINGQKITKKFVKISQ
ncbi:MAG: T9SS type A sorting domain-containing protein, partial [Bacteroidetes bacterium]|nr:T9SS type A sorting domain-containing protein [Bacteroidota bacterium]